jgi:hypothetical protein
MLWKPNKPALWLPSRRVLLTGAAALAAYSALPVRPSKAAVAGTNMACNGIGTASSITSTSANYSTASVLIIVTITNTISSGTSNVPTLTGSAGLNVTWTQINTANLNQTRTTVFAAYFSSAPGSATVTADFASQSQTGIAISVDQFTGTATTVGAAIPQSVTGTQNGSPISITLGSLTSGSASFGGFTISAARGQAVGSGYTLLGQTGANSQILTEYKATGSTTVNATVFSGDNTGIALEIAVPGATTTPKRSLMGVGQ